MCTNLSTYVCTCKLTLVSRGPDVGLAVGSPFLLQQPGCHPPERGAAGARVRVVLGGEPSPAPLGLQITLSRAEGGFLLKQPCSIHLPGPHPGTGLARSTVLSGQLDSQGTVLKLPLAPPPSAYRVSPLLMVQGTGCGWSLKAGPSSPAIQALPRLISSHGTSWNLGFLVWKQVREHADYVTAKSSSPQPLFQGSIQLGGGGPWLSPYTGPCGRTE